MWLRTVLCLLAAGVTASSALAETTNSQCGLSDVKDIRDLQTALQNRAIEAINLAASGTNESRLRQLVDSSAVFSTGSGDVGGPIGKGVAGIRMLAKDMEADKYRAFEWSGLPYRVFNACDTQEANVEFTNTSGRESFDVKFKFNFGRIVGAETWLRSFSTGALESVRK